MNIGSGWKTTLSGRARRDERRNPTAADESPMYETVILGGGPAGTGSLVWAARHGRLGTWLDSGVALVEQTGQLGGALGQYPLNADSRGTSFLECLDGPHCEAALTGVRADPVTTELERWREGRPTLRLVNRFERCVGSAILSEFARHPNSRAFTGATALAIRQERGGPVAILIATQGGRRSVIRAASAVVALGGRPITSWSGVELGTGLCLGDWRSKILASHRLLTRGGAQEVGRRLARINREPRVVIVGGAHSAFSSAWMLLEQVPGLRFGPRSVHILHRSEPRPTYVSRGAAWADRYEFSESDVCQVTGRVHRLGGLQGDGREVWRRIHGKPGAERDERAVTMPINSLTRAELKGLLDNADLIVPALGYRLATIPIYDADGHPVRLASTGPAVRADARLLAADGTPVPGVFGVGLGSGFVPWGAMAGEASFAGQQNSLWLYQNGLGELIYNSTRRLAQQQMRSPATTFDANPSRDAGAALAATSSASSATKEA
ncbi:hypothetical protein A9W99_20290 [Mycobacterium sp. 1164966.3]|uniref:hypothetical protein n=1 Tax=Mycobacterium sp. 1164966.3 TaxID=1856861 RepID=UPI0007FB7469|nr:hypothetical protein [Mycobacterium sp. 1164966.3]OBA79568.1 hypothetical protein A9W99_20290 [Mycobacterium sp. 1164966.3]